MLRICLESLSWVEIIHYLSRILVCLVPTEIKQASRSALCEIQQKRVGKLIKLGLAKGILQSGTEIL